MKNKIILVIILVFLFYYWTATGSHNTFNLEAAHGGMYNLLTDGFLSGHLYLPVEPRPELLALSDPYDPAQNGPYRLHDASLYKGKYYLYFGPTPAITLYMPYRLLTNHRFPDNLAVFIFSFGTFLWSLLTLIYLQKRYFNKIPGWMLLTSIAIIGLGNFSLYNLRRTEMYEVAISCGSFFLSGSLYFFCRSLETHIPKMLYLLLGSFFLGLAVGGRFQIALSSLILPLLFIKVLKTNTRKDIYIKSLLSLAIPFIFCLILIVLYNHLRFGNLLDFGHKYQLAGIHLKTVNYFRLQFLLPGIHYFILQFPTINSSFPFIHPYGTLPTFLTCSLPYFTEKIVGLLPGVPFLNLIYLGPIVYWFAKRNSCKTICSKDTILKNSFILFILLSITINIFLVFLKLLPSNGFLDDITSLLEKIVKFMPSIIILISIFLGYIVFWLYNSYRKCEIECKPRTRFPLIEFAAIFIPAFLNLSALLFLPMVTVRYLADFSTQFILATCLVWFYFDLILEDGTRYKNLLRNLGYITAIVSILFGNAFGIIGCYSGLRDQNPLLYSNIENSFNWLSNILKSISPLWGQQ